MNELQLIEGCKKGKRECQKYLYERYARSMFGLCLRYATDADAAQDLLQEGFIKIFSSIGSYSGKGSFEGWMKKIFINLALRSIRKEKALVHIDDIQNMPDIEDENLSEKAYDISEEELIRMIQDLPKGYQMVFNLYAVEELSHKEIAGMLNIAEGTSRSQYMRAKQMLKEKVLEYLKINN